ncbi:hypothetical protein D3C87_1873320 [compost metagenome]
MVKFWVFAVPEMGSILAPESWVPGMESWARLMVSDSAPIQLFMVKLVTDGIAIRDFSDLKAKEPFSESCFLQAVKEIAAARINWTFRDVIFIMILLV